ncbi:hypothetical protein [Permianibacter aggregans]|uniref:Uncharacterized protein n=1 Tax=Permianibacter aggregans TaxID=1510150 RepID=A0A4R6UFE2_9GAMM|nr:hypothetical protein [Permianibacter aggregans]QGX38426.1 hypothetical protein E2H98_01590 [Permianibacter aggregans]TDQ45540.1 hypothetical protein EV696_1198 [Permianibacter aggregans]
MIGVEAIYGGMLAAIFMLFLLLASLAGTTIGVILFVKNRTLISLSIGIPSFVVLGLLVMFVFHIFVESEPHVFSVTLNKEERILLNDSGLRCLDELRPYMCFSPTETTKVNVQFPGGRMLSIQGGSFYVMVGENNEILRVSFTLKADLNHSEVMDLIDDYRKYSTDTTKFDSERKQLISWINLTANSRSTKDHAVVSYDGEGYSLILEIKKPFSSSSGFTVWTHLNIKNQ